VGPVVLTLANGVTVNGGTVGASDHPEWLALRVANGGLTLNSGSNLHGLVLTPAGTVTINSGTVHGRVAADRLTINGNGTLVDPSP